jgi:hypothetical protein
MTDELFENNPAFRLAERYNSSSSVEDRLDTYSVSSVLGIFSGLKQEPITVTRKAEFFDEEDQEIATNAYCRTNEEGKQVVHDGEQLLNYLNSGRQFINNVIDYIGVNCISINFKESKGYGSELEGEESIKHAEFCLKLRDNVTEKLVAEAIRTRSDEQLSDYVDQEIVKNNSSAGIVSQLLVDSSSDDIPLDYFETAFDSKVSVLRSVTPAFSERLKEYSNAVIKCAELVIDGYVSGELQLPPLLPVEEDDPIIEFGLWKEVNQSGNDSGEISLDDIEGSDELKTIVETVTTHSDDVDITYRGLLFDAIIGRILPEIDQPHELNRIGTSVSRLVNEFFTADGMYDQLKYSPIEMRNLLNSEDMINAAIQYNYLVPGNNESDFTQNYNQVRESMSETEDGREANLFLGQYHIIVENFKRLITGEENLPATIDLSSEPDEQYSAPEGQDDEDEFTLDELLAVGKKRTFFGRTLSGLVRGTPSKEDLDSTDTSSHDTQIYDEPTGEELKHLAGEDKTLAEHYGETEVSKPAVKQSTTFGMPSHVAKTFAGIFSLAAGIYIGATHVNPQIDAEKLLNSSLAGFSEVHGARVIDVYDITQDEAYQKLLEDNQKLDEALELVKGWNKGWQKVCVPFLPENKSQ